MLIKIPQFDLLLLVSIVNSKCSNLLNNYYLGKKKRKMDFEKKWKTNFENKNDRIRKFLSFLFLFWEFEKLKDYSSIWVGKRKRKLALSKVRRRLAPHRLTFVMHVFQKKKELLDATTCLCRSYSVVRCGESARHHWILKESDSALFSYMKNGGRHKNGKAHRDLYTKSIKTSILADNKKRKLETRMINRHPGQTQKVCLPF